VGRVALVALNSLLISGVKDGKKEKEIFSETSLAYQR
jgi:hypothetical protein